MNAVATAESVVKTHALEGIGLAGVGLNGDSKVTESLTTSCAYDHLWVGCRLEFATYSLFWLGMAPNSKTDGSGPCQNVLDLVFPQPLTK